MNKSEFIERYRRFIRVNVDWQLFKDDRVELVERDLELPRDLNRLWTPWFPGGTSHNVSDPNGAPLSVLGAAADITLLGSHEEGIRTCMSKIGGDDFEAPAVAFSKQRYLLLDQNHHTVAAALLELRVRIRLALIVPPPNEHILVDVPGLDA